MKRGRLRLHRGLTVATVAAALAATAAMGAVPEQAASASGAAADDWIMYHYDQERHGYDPDAVQASGTLSSAWKTTLDGAVYAEPLVVNDQVIAATENDSVYALSLDGDVLWRLHLGDAVPASELPCSNIDPLGITSTPIYSPETGDLYVAAELDNPIRHELFAVDIASGQVDWSQPLDPPGMAVEYQQQRAGLAIAQGKVWAGFGALAGICGPYHGWLVGYPIDGTGDMSVYETPSEKGGSIWGPSGPAVGVNGNPYIATGAAEAQHPPFDFGNAVVELDRDAQEVDYFAPKKWAHYNIHDRDLGSLGPLMFSAFGKDWVFQNGKGGTGFLLKQKKLGGIGGQAAKIVGCQAWGSDAIFNDIIYVSCHNFLVAYQVLPGPSLVRLWRNKDSGYGAGPVVGGGAVWVAFQSRIWQIDPMTGKTVATAPTGSVLPHFASPTLHGSLVLVGTMSGVTAISTSGEERSSG